jgi:tRNA dimethylallyltransferase
MVAEGLVDEVAGLIKRHGELSRTAAQALGYRELIGHFRGEATLDEAVAETVRRTRAFARRQRMWWRRDPMITWLGTAEEPLAVTAALLRDWGVP